MKTGESGTPELSALRSRPLVAGFFWAAVLVAAILDTRSQFNVVFIAALGDWVTLQETINLGVGTNALGWEHHIAHTLDSTFYPLIRLSGTLLTVLLFAVAVILFVPRQKNEKGIEPSGDIRALCLGSGLAAFILLGLVSQSFQHKSSAATIHAVVWAVLGCYSLWRCLAKALPPDEDT